MVVSYIVVVSFIVGVSFIDGENHPHVVSLLTNYHIMLYRVHLPIRIVWVHNPTREPVYENHNIDMLQLTWITITEAHYKGWYISFKSFKLFIVWQSGLSGAIILPKTINFTSYKSQWYKGSR